MAGEHDTTLSAEEVQIIRSRTVGGFGPFPVRAYRQVLKSILPRVTFSLNDIRDPRSKRRGRPSAATQHRLRHGRIQLYRGVALAAVEAVQAVEALKSLQKLRAEGRNARRQQQRQDEAAIKALRRTGRVGCEVLADWLSEQADQRKTAQVELDEQRREFVRFVIDELRLNLKTLIERHTRLRGERRERAIGDTLVALQLAGSGEPAAVKMRFRLMPPELKAAAKKTEKPTT